MICDEQPLTLTPPPTPLQTIRTSLSRTRKVVILDESTASGGVGATVSAQIHEQCFDLLDAPVRRLAMDDAPVPYASSMERAVVKCGADVVQAVIELAIHNAEAVCSY
jgi:pyruvate/2-oxoglutarate/acetoin dehydrogenase E1 component